MFSSFFIMTFGRSSVGSEIIWFELLRCFLIRKVIPSFDMIWGFPGVHGLCVFCVLLGGLLDSGTAT